MYWKICSISTWIVSLPSRSSTVTSLICASDTSPCTNWYAPGSIFSSHFVSLHRFRISLFASALAVGIAKRIVLIWYFSTAEKIDALPPTIGTSSIFLPHLFLLSSIMHCGVPLIRLEVFNSRSRFFPASPAPITIIFRPFVWFCSFLTCAILVLSRVI